MSQEQTQQFMRQIQMLENFVGDLHQRESTLLTVLKEAYSAIDAVKSFGEKDNSDTLMPVGMGVFVKAKVSSQQKIVLNIGAGVVMEKDRESALTFLESRIKEIEISIQDTSAKRQEAMRRLEQTTQEANKLVQSNASPR